MRHAPVPHPFCWNDRPTYITPQVWPSEPAVGYDLVGDILASTSKPQALLRIPSVALPIKGAVPYLYTFAHRTVVRSPILQASTLTYLPSHLLHPSGTQRPPNLQYPVSCPNTYRQPAPEIFTKFLCHRIGTLRVKRTNVEPRFLRTSFSSQNL